MYYPIIDKLKDVMEEIGQGGGGNLVIAGTLTSSAGGTWTGNFSDIVTALNSDKLCIFKYTDSNGITYLPPILAFSAQQGIGIAGIGDGSSVVINQDNTFVIE